MTFFRKLKFNSFLGDATAYIGDLGEIFFAETDGSLRISDGATAGGTVVGGGGSLVGFTASLNTDAPNDSKNASVLAASGGATDQNIVLLPAGNGGLLLSLPDGESTGGNQRGANAVDLQILVADKNSPTQVASGDYSFACGFGNTASGFHSFVEGFSNVSSNWASHAEGFEGVASGFAAHSEGSGATASGDYSHAEGNSTEASGDYSHAEGFQSIASVNYAHAEGNGGTASGIASHTQNENCTASGEASHAGGTGSQATAGAAFAHGVNCLADATGSVATGQDSITRGILYYQGYSTGGFANAGDHQMGRLGLKGATADATPLVITSDANGASSANQMTFAANSIRAVNGTVAALSQNDDGSQGDCAMWSIAALFASTNTNVVGEIGSPAVTQLFNTDGASSWSVSITADNSESASAISVTVTGADATLIRWSGELRTQEITFPPDPPP